MGESRVENQLENLTGSASGLETPKSRVEEILQAMIDGTEVPENDKSRVEILLAELAKQGGGGGGITPTGSIDITQNGTYDVTNYAEADVNVQQQVPVLGAERLGTVSGDVVINEEHFNATGLFDGNANITSLSMPNWVGSENPSNALMHWFLRNCSKLVSLYIPKAIIIGESTLCGLESIKNMFLDSVIYIGGNSVQRCTNLETFVGPKCNTIYSASFQTCPKLKAVDILGSRTAAEGLVRGNNGFSGCPSFDTLILRSTAMVTTLSAINIFSTASKFKSGASGGTIYVPEALVSDYEQASNWAAVLALNSNNRILPIEGSIYETQYADGTPIQA